MDKEILNRLIIEGIQDRKGKGICIVDLSDIDTCIAQTFIICQGQSTMHVSSVADSIREYVQEHGGVKPFNYDGYGNSEWIVIDYGETMVHVFLPEARMRYNLEELYSDVPVTEVPDLD